MSQELKDAYGREVLKLAQRRRWGVDENTQTSTTSTEKSTETTSTDDTREPWYLRYGKPILAAAAITTAGIWAGPYVYHKWIKPEQPENNNTGSLYQYLEDQGHHVPHND